jgi:hypothetical protein
MPCISFLNANYVITKGYRYSNDLINMNIEINIETLLFGNDTYTDHTNSKIFEENYMNFS